MSKDVIVEYKGDKEWIEEAKAAIRDFRALLSELYEDGELDGRLRRQIRATLHKHDELPDWYEPRR